MTQQAEIERVRTQLVELLSGGAAHVDFETAVQRVPLNARGAKPEGQPHTPWRLLEHMRIAQWDIVEFCINPEHVSPDWPDGYWPEEDAPTLEEDWDFSVRSFIKDRQTLIDLVKDQDTDIMAPIPHGGGQTILREAVLAADHTSYHIGEMVIVRRLLDVWP